MNKKIEQIINVCETCSFVRLLEIVESVCGIYIDPEHPIIDRDTYIDMIKGTLIHSQDNKLVNSVYDALKDLDEF